MHSGGSGGGGGSDSSGALWAACDQSRHVNQILRVSYEASAMHTNTEPESSWVESNLACHLFPPHLSGWAPVCCHAFFIYSVHKNRFSPFFVPFASTLTDKNFFFFPPNYSMQLHCWDSKSRGLFLHCLVHQAASFWVAAEAALENLRGSNRDRKCLAVAKADDSGSCRSRG